MKTPRINGPMVMLGLSALGLVAFAAVLIIRAFEPPPLKFVSLNVVNPSLNSEELLTVIAETRRRVRPKCVNGVQVELRDASGAQTRLPIPARELAGNLATYSIVIPKDTTPARYQMLVREVFTCPSGVEQVEAPWLPIEVVQ